MSVQTSAIDLDTGLDTHLAASSEHELIGEVRTIRDFDGWCIVNIFTKDHGSQVVTGEFDIDAGELTRGLSYRFFGTWKTHPIHGPQFAVDSYVTASEQTNIQGISAYIERVGKFILTGANVRAIVKEFGAASIKMLRENPKEVYCLCPQIDPERIGQASSYLIRAAAMEPTRIALFEIFCGRGIPRGAIEDCIDTWGERAPSVIKKDPFKLLVHEISGIGFRRADKLYLDLGYPKERLKRQMIAVWYDMMMDMSGHTWHRSDIAEKAALKAAGADTRFEAAIELGIRSKWLTAKHVDGERWITETEKAVAEEKIAIHVKRILGHKSSCLPQEEDGYQGLGLSRHQLDVIKPLISSPLFILAGTPGTGKTFSVAQIIRLALTRLHKEQIAVVAPTGKAAVRITEAMERYKIPLQATTIHSYLGVRGYRDGKWIFEFTETQPAPERLIVVDEMSMTDTTLLSNLLGAVNLGSTVILVGDPYQLPPVGHGAPLRDLIAANVPCGLLSEIQRNSGAIVEGCKAIKDGGTPTFYERGELAAGRNLVIIECNQDASVRLGWISRILNKVRTNGIDGIPMDPVWDVQVLCATNKVKADFNRSLQDALNPQVDGVHQENLQFRIGDKIICQKNTRAALRKFGDIDDIKEIEKANPSELSVFARWKSNRGLQAYLANGDIGRVLATKKDVAIVRFVCPDRIVQITTQNPKKGGDNGDEEKTGDFALGYALTTHKFQGSECPIVIINLENAHYVTNREWIYTALSRGKQLVIALGSPQDIARMIMKTGLRDRKTFLRELLAGEIKLQDDMKGKDS